MSAGGAVAGVSVVIFMVSSRDEGRFLGSIAKANAVSILQYMIVTITQAICFIPCGLASSLVAAILLCEDEYSWFSPSGCRKLL